MATATTTSRRAAIVAGARVTRWLVGASVAVRPLVDPVLARIAVNHNEVAAADAG